MGRIIRALLALGPLLVGAVLMISGGMCVVSGALSLVPAMALIGLASLLLGYGLTRAAYRWVTQESEPSRHDS